MNEKPIQLTHEQRQDDATSIFGFWVYLMTDLMLFASLFAVFAVMRGSTFGGPSGKDIFDLHFALLETIVLLVSSFSCGLALLSARAQNVVGAVISLIITAGLGLTFVILEVSEFGRFVALGDGPSRSGFLSSFFTLVGTHGLHVSIGLIWLLSLVAAIVAHGFTRATMRKLVLFGMFWHFLDIVWIFIFTIVYLLSTV